MVFSEYMESLPNLKVDTVNEIAKLTCSSTVSVYNWISGRSEPPTLKKRIIADYLGKSVEELFPPIEQEKMVGNGI